MRNEVAKSSPHNRELPAPSTTYTPSTYSTQLRDPLSPDSCCQLKARRSHAALWRSRDLEPRGTLHAPPLGWQGKRFAVQSSAKAKSLPVRCQAADHRPPTTDPRLRLTLIHGIAACHTTQPTTRDGSMAVWLSIAWAREMGSRSVQPAVWPPFPTSQTIHQEGAQATPNLFVPASQIQSHSKLLIISSCRPSLLAVVDSESATEHRCETYLGSFSPFRPRLCIPFRPPYYVGPLLIISPRHLSSNHIAFQQRQSCSTTHASFSPIQPVTKDPTDKITQLLRCLAHSP